MAFDPKTSVPQHSRRSPKTLRMCSQEQWETFGRGGKSGSCLGEPISSQVRRNLPAFHDLRLHGEVSTESEETSSGKESVPRAYITADLKQVVLTYDQVAPIELEGLEIKKISILEPFIEFHNSQWQELKRSGSTFDPCAVWVFEADLTAGNESKANMTVMLHNTGLGIGLFVARVKCPAFAISFDRSQVSVYLPSGESKNFTFGLDASQFTDHREVSQECRFRASVRSQPMFSDVGKSMGTCRKVITSYFGSFTPVCELVDKDPVLLLRIFEALGNNETVKAIRMIEMTHSLRFISAVQIKLTAHGGTLKAISNIRVVCQQAYIGLNLETLLYDNLLASSPIVDEYYGSFPQAIFFFGRENADMRSQCYFEVWAHRPHYRCHQKEVIVKEKIILTQRDQIQLSKFYNKLIFVA
ncbi:uncharacterized protein LOC134178546 [Corticium candelabrum]|uniref:uncharacterized protein LOC134178546 n=1 Tax=Corticium candelabrum TaxID=121492 RepID=UPI002E25F6EA|nr:uncharacterized protein LOC134178546 [Corticium candelabrum]